jgi:hypothetical protein
MRRRHSRPVPAPPAVRSIDAHTFSCAVFDGQWLQFVTATTRLHVENLLGREGYYQPGRVRILSEGGAEPASLSTF